MELKEELCKRNVLSFVSHLLHPIALVLISGFMADIYGQDSGDQQKKALLIVPPDFEPIEIATALSVLAEAGIRVETTSITADVKPINGMTNIQIIPERSLPTVDESLYNALIITGGEESVWNMIQTPALLSLIELYGHENRIIGANNITPKLLQACNVYRGHVITASWAVRRYLSIYRFVYRKTNVDRLLVTGSSVAYSLEWAFALVARLLSDQLAAQLANQWYLRS